MQWCAAQGNHFGHGLAVPGDDDALALLHAFPEGGALVAQVTDGDTHEVSVSPVIRVACACFRIASLTRVIRYGVARQVLSAVGSPTWSKMMPLSFFDAASYAAAHGSFAGNNL